MKRIGERERREILEFQRSGASDTELKRKYSIKDNRTLDRHLRLAEQEERLRIVQVEIIKGAITDHHKELRALIERISNNMRVFQPDEIYPNVVIPNQDVKNMPLFQQLKSHVPQKKLWSLYISYEKQFGELVALCLALREKVASDIGKWKGIAGVTENVAQPILLVISERAKGQSNRYFSFQASAITGNQNIISIKVDGIEAFGVLAQTDEKRLEKRYQEYCDKINDGEAGKRILEIFRELKYELEPKLRNLFQEALDRRDYIMNTCRLCPGQPK